MTFEYECCDCKEKTTDREPLTNCVWCSSPNIVVVAYDHEAEVPELEKAEPLFV
jgi:Zn finger protein HypA/HybF involved in hydrogenase expression